MEMNNDIFTPDLPIPEPVSFEDAPIPTPVEEETPAAAPPPRRRRKADAPVLTIESGDEIETEDAREAAAWHEIHNAYRTRRILSAPLGGIEQTDSGKTIAVVDYNGFRIVIPLKEMMVMPNAANSTESMVVRQMKLLGNMLGAEIDFVILGIDSKTRSVVASRREAMMRKRQLFYFSPDANGEYRVREGRVVHIYSDDLSRELVAHAVGTGADSWCEGQWETSPAQPEELPTQPVGTVVEQIAPPRTKPGFERFDFGRAE